MRCHRCKAKAVLYMPRHNSAACAQCLSDYTLNQVRRAITNLKMFHSDEEILVAVSGGKDSLVLWDVLIRLGYKTSGLHIHQGIGEYSDLSYQKSVAFSMDRGKRLTVHSMEREEGGGVTELAQIIRRPPCSACGMLKRYHFNKYALDLGYHVVATGHNLDDEAARLLGNLLLWQDEYLEKQSPVLPKTHRNFVRKVKPLYRLTEREISAYAFVRGIDYVIEECPMSVHSKQLVYKDALNRLESASPGTKQTFYFGFLDRQPAETIQQSDQALQSCERCGQPTSASVCSYCRLMARTQVGTS